MLRGLEELTVADRAEQQALFRAQVLGALLARPLNRGELRAGLLALAQQRFRRPGADRSRSFAVPTLERCYYRYRHGGLAALRPQSRSDLGRARALTEEQRALLLEVRRAHPTASAALILRTLTDSGRLPPQMLTARTLRRLYQQAGLPRASRKLDDQTVAEVRQRLRWQAQRVDQLWQGDVCHLMTLQDGHRRVPVLLHALLDDHSRYLVHLEVRCTEREQDMLEVLLQALRRGPPPDSL